MRFYSLHLNSFPILLNWLALMLFYSPTIAIASAQVSEDRKLESSQNYNLDLDVLCNKFPLNSRCSNDNYSHPKSKPKIYKLKRDSFCRKFPFNSHCQKKPVQILKVALEGSGEDEEQIFIEKNDNTIKLSHQIKVTDDLASLAIDEAIGLIPIPDFFGFLSLDLLIDTEPYSWHSHKVTRVTFKSDRCKQIECEVTGKNSLKLPVKTNIYQGLFTIYYREKNLKRSLSFRIPADLEAIVIDTVIIEVPETSKLAK